MDEGVLVQDRNGAILHCNAAAERILGLSADQLRGRTSVDPRWRSVHEDGSPFPGTEHPAMVCLRTGAPQRQVRMGVHKPDGTLTWIRINAHPIRTAGAEQHHAVVATFADISEERELAILVRARAEQLALVLEGANDGFWDWDIPSGRVVFSSRWAAMIGYDPSELTGDLGTWSQRVHPDDSPAVMEVLEQHLRGESPFYETEHRLQHRDGHWIWVLDRGKVVARDAAGQPLRATGTHTDVTARREVEAQLRATLRSNERLVTDLRDALDRVKTLTGLLPLCAWCKSVRNDQGYWQKIEHYLAQHTDAKFTHGLCPNCSKNVLPQ